MNLQVPIKTIEIPSSREEICIHLFFVENADFVGVKYWVWIKEIKNNIIKKTSGFIRKYVIYLFFGSVKKKKLVINVRKKFA